MKWLRLTATALCLALSPVFPAAADVRGEMAARTCAAIAARVDAIPGNGAVFLQSYDPTPGTPDERALIGAAFVYDNSLAAIALTACGKPHQAARIGAALLAAGTADRSGETGRIRNAYRAGVQSERPLPPMGWWDDKSNRWLEDPYQVGSAVGNLAWTGLALLTLYDANRDPAYRDGAARIAAWIVGHTRDDRGPGGFTGGVQGYDAEAKPLTWKSTEHNTDVAAFLARLSRAGGGDRTEPAMAARRFVAAMWDPAAGRFRIGTTPDGTTPAEHPSGLDAQLWPLLLADPPADWKRAFAYAERAHGVAGGFDFNDDRDGLWTEGTAQAALVARALGRADEADRLLAVVARQASPGGFLWATARPSITTGLAIGPESTTDDFLYYRRPHLAPTAWAALAALGWNPFSGTRLH